MKMLCIRGRQHRMHTGLFTGRVYEVSIVNGCCGPRAWAEGSVFKRPMKLACQHGSKVYTYVPWCPSRFVPWQPDALKSIMHEAKSALAPRKRSKPRERVT